MLRSAPTRRSLARTAPEEFDTEAARKIFTQMVSDERTPQRKIWS